MIFNIVQSVIMLTIPCFALWTISSFNRPTTLPLVLQHQKGLGNYLSDTIPSVCLKEAITRTKLFCTLASFDVSSKMLQSIFDITSHFEQYQGDVVYVSLTLKDETQIW